MQGRIRTIKPEAHLDEDLWDLEIETDLPLFRAFTGLWNYSDREGRFEWRPRALKAVILPYWDGDFSRVLDALATRGFIVKYASEARELGVVRTFKDHQSINNREAPSELPPPPDNIFEKQILTTRESRVDDASSTRESRDDHADTGEWNRIEWNRARVDDASPARSPDLKSVFVWQAWEEEAGRPCGDFSYQLKHCQSILDTCLKFPDPESVIREVVKSIWDEFRGKGKVPEIRFLAADIGKHLPGNGKPEDGDIPVRMTIAEGLADDARRQKLALKRHFEKQAREEKEKEQNLQEGGNA